MERWSFCSRVADNKIGPGCNGASPGKRRAMATAKLRREPVVGAQGKPEPGKAGPASVTNPSKWRTKHGSLQGESQPVTRIMASRMIFSNSRQLFKIML